MKSMFWQGYPAAMPSTHGIWAVAVGTARVVRTRAKLAPARRFNVSGMGQRYGERDGPETSLGCLRRRRGRGARMTGRQSHLNNLALSAMRRGRFLFGNSPCAQACGLASAFFPKRKPRTLVRGLLGGWLMGFEPTTLGTTNRCSNQLSYSHRVPSLRPRVALKGAQRYSRCLNVKPFPWGLLSTFEA